jgi:hypothetical protein
MKVWFQIWITLGEGFRMARGIQKIIRDHNLTVN